MLIWDRVVMNRWLTRKPIFGPLKTIPLGHLGSCWLNNQLWLRSWSCSWWVRAPRWACCCQLVRAELALDPLSPSPCPSPTCALPKINCLKKYYKEIILPTLPSVPSIPIFILKSNSKSNAKLPEPLLRLQKQMKDRKAETWVLRLIMIWTILVWIIMQ